MTFLPDFGAEYCQTVGSRLIRWIYNDSMYVRFGGTRNTKTCSKSKFSHKN